jgi:hypothetical protein
MEVEKRFLANTNCVSQNAVFGKTQKKWNHKQIYPQIKQIHSGVT